MRYFNFTADLRVRTEAWLVQNELSEYLNSSKNAENFLTDLWSEGDLGVFANQKNIIDSYRGTVPLNQGKLVQRLPVEPLN